MSFINDATAFSNITKVMYRKGRVENLGYKSQPFLALMEKDTTFGGKSRAIAVRYGSTAGTSVNFSYALANSSADQYAQYVVTRTPLYSTAEISNEMFLAAKSGEYSMADGPTSVMDGAIYKNTRTLAVHAFRNGGGCIGQIATGVTLSGTVITFQTADDVHNFEKNDVICLSSDDGSSATPAGVRSGTLTVTKVNRSGTAPSITVNAAINTIPGASTGDYISIQGNYAAVFKGAGLSQADPTVAGNTNGWICTPTTGDNFYGQDRTSDSRLSGLTANYQGQNMEESLIDSIANLEIQGGNPTHLFTHPKDLANLLKALQARATLDPTQAKSTIGITFYGVKVPTSRGYCTILGDVACPKGSFLLTQLDTWKLESIGPAPQVIKSDGNIVRFDPNSDTLIFRVGSYCAVTNWAPNYSMNGRW